MIQKIKSFKGITLISMILTIIVLILIVGTISYSSRDSLQLKKLDNFFNDIDALNDAVSVYYIKNNALPVYYSTYDINGNSGEYREICIDNSGSSYLNIPEVDSDDLNSYCILDISKLENISLNNSNNIPAGIDSGSFFLNKSNDTKKLEDSIDKGIFIVNSLSHNVYYTKGLKVDGNTYYSKKSNYSKIPTFISKDKNSVEEDVINEGRKNNKIEEDELKIIFWANGGTNAPEEITVSKSKTGTTEDLLVNILTNGNNGVGEPLKLGMNFIGWTLDETSSVASYILSTYKKEYKMAPNNSSIKFSEYAGNVINLYAVWEKDDSKIFKCYYPAGTGGVKPTIDDTEVNRIGAVEAASNPICIDIPTSGYKISWKWENNSSSNDIQEARYVGESTTTIIPKDSDEIIYETTEPGSIQLVGNFIALKVYITDDKAVTNNIKIELDERGKFINFYKASIEIGKETRDKVGDRAKVKGNDAVWMTGVDGKFTVPSNPQTYIELGVMDPSRTNNYKEKIIKNGNVPDFYLKSVILTDSNNLENIDYENKTKELGSIVAAQKDDVQYCLYPRFGARNYKIVDENNNEYYHESLQEAYEQAGRNNLNRIILLRDVYRSNITDEENYEKYYVKNYDPTYSKIVKFASNDITLDFDTYTMTRQGSIQVSNNVKLTTRSSTTSLAEKGLIFEKTTASEGIKLENNAKLYLIAKTLLKNENGVVINLKDNSKFYGRYGVVENSSEDDQKANAIISSSSNTNICLGILNNEVSELNNNDIAANDNIIIKTKKGVAINTKGKIYWKYGKLQTEDKKNKIGYSSSVLYVKNASEKAPCIAYNATNQKVEIILDKRNWEFKDEDSGNLTTYYSTRLQEANDSLNLENIEKTYTIKWLNPVADSEASNNATINKRMEIDFDSFKDDDWNPKFNTSKLIIMSKNVEIKNLYCETTKGIAVGNEKNRNVSLKITDCYIGTNTPGVSAIINYGQINYNASTSKTSGFYTKATSGTSYAINNYGNINYNVGNSKNDIIYTSGNSRAISNYGSNNIKATFVYKGNNNSENSICSKTSSTADCVVFNGNTAYMEYNPGDNGKFESQITNTANKVLWNTGEFICSSGTIKLNSVKETSGNTAIYNYGILKFGGTTKIESNYIGISMQTSSIAYIYNRAKINAKNYGITNASGKLYIASNITIDSNGSIRLSNDSTSDFGPEISGTESFGVYVSLTGEVTLGVNESPLSVSEAFPIITSKKTYGIRIASANSKFYFYDGIVRGNKIGDTIYSVSENAIETPENYRRETRTEGDYKITKLKPIE